MPECWCGRSFPSEQSLEAHMMLSGCMLLNQEAMVTEMQVPSAARAAASQPTVRRPTPVPSPVPVRFQSGGVPSHHGQRGG